MSVGNLGGGGAKNLEDRNLLNKEARLLKFHFPKR